MVLNFEGIYGSNVVIIVGGVSVGIGVWEAGTKGG